MKTAIATPVEQIPPDQVKAFSCKMDCFQISDKAAVAVMDPRAPTFTLILGLLFQLLPS